MGAWRPTISLAMVLQKSDWVLEGLQWFGLGTRGSIKLALKTERWALAPPEREASTPIRSGPRHTVAD